MTNKRGRKLRPLLIEPGKMYTLDEAAKIIFNTSAVLLAERSDISLEKWRGHITNYNSGRITTDLVLKLVEAQGLRVVEPLKVML